MPLLRQTPFIKRKVPRGLGAKESLYYLELTDEVFTEYEDYANRILQCNALIWSCEETKRTELTYSEALECERNARKILAAYPDTLKVPALYLASITETTCIDKMVTDIFRFMHNRYFVGEFVIPHGRKKNWTNGRIVCVASPAAHTLISGKNVPFKKHETKIPPSKYTYLLDSDYNGTDPTFHVVCATKLKRQDLFTEEMLSVFLKKNTVLDHSGMWIIKESTNKEFNLHSVQFAEIFIGEPPVFLRGDTEIGRRSKARKRGTAELGGESTHEERMCVVKKPRGRSATPKRKKSSTKAVASKSEQRVRSDTPSRKGSKQTLKEKDHMQKGENGYKRQEKQKGDPVALKALKGQQKIDRYFSSKPKNVSVDEGGLSEEHLQDGSDCGNKNTKSESVSTTTLGHKEVDSERENTLESIKNVDLNAAEGTFPMRGSVNVICIESSNDSDDESLYTVLGASSVVSSRSLDHDGFISESSMNVNSSIGSTGTSKRIFGVDSDNNSTYTQTSAKSVDWEAGSECSVDSRIMLSSLLETSVCNSESEVSKFEGETGSDEDIEVVWSSTVRPNRQIKKKIWEMYSSQKAKETNWVSESESDTSKSFVSSSSAESGESGKYVTLETLEKLTSSDTETKEKLSKNVAMQSNRKRTREDDDEPIKRKAKKTNICVEESVFGENLGKNTSLNLKQTLLFDGRYDRKNADTSDNSGEKKTSKLDPLSSKKAFKKKSSNGRNLKVAGTLKPWVHTTKTIPTPKEAVEEAPKHSSFNLKNREDKRNWLEIQRQSELQKKLKRQEERRLLKAKKEEEKLKFANFLKEWKKPREDQLCEDLKPLPPTCVINFRLSNEIFGDFMMILEFFHSFMNILNVKSVFPNGLTFEYLERAIVDTEIAGPLIDIIHVLLTGIFAMQISDSDNAKSGVPIEDAQSGQYFFEDCTPTAGSRVFLGVPLHDVPINYGTVSEVLRIFLLGSGHKVWNSTSKWSSPRGGYRDLEDSGLRLCLEKPLILEKLSHSHICELNEHEKLRILTCLVNQLLSYPTIRDELDDRSNAKIKAKANLKALQVAGFKLQKEAASKRYRARKEVKLSKLSFGDHSPRALASQEEFELENQRMKQEVAKLKANVQKKMSELLPLIMSYQLLPIGYDRGFRRYWLFSSLPGLFVENDPFEMGECLPQPTPQTSDMPDTLTHVRRLFEKDSQCAISDKENYSAGRDISKPQVVSPKKMLGEHNKSVETQCDEKENSKTDEELETQDTRELLICTSSETCPVHSFFSPKPRWSFFPKEEDVSVLLECLNERGIRESALRHVILQEQQIIVESIRQCPLQKLNPEKFIDTDREQRKSTRNFSGYTPESARLNFPLNTSISYIMEWNLRDHILELENKISYTKVGSLKVYDRLAWRAAIEGGRYDQQCDSLECSGERGSSYRVEEPEENITELLTEDVCSDKEQQLSQEENLSKLKENMEDDMSFSGDTDTENYGQELIHQAGGSEQEKDVSGINSISSFEKEEGNVPEEKINNNDADDVLESLDNVVETCSQNVKQHIPDEKMELRFHDEICGGSTVGENSQEKKKSDIEMCGESEIEDLNKQNEDSDHVMSGVKTARENSQEKEDSDDTFFEKLMQEMKNQNEDSDEVICGEKNVEDQEKEDSDLEKFFENIMQEMEKQKENSDQVTGGKTVGEKSPEKEKPDLEMCDDSYMPEINNGKEDSGQEICGGSTVGENSLEKKESDIDMEKLKIDEDTECDKENSSEQETNDGVDSLPESLLQNPEKSDIDLECDDRDDNSDKELCNSHDSTETRDTVSDKSNSGTSSQNPVVRELARALLQLGQSVNAEYLQKPLVRGKRPGKAPFNHWEVSLMDTINLSQIYIHYSALEHSINWPLSTPCCICGLRHKPNKIVSCIRCNRRQHIFCMQPKLKTIPKDDWVCSGCNPAERRSYRIKERSNVLQDSDNQCEMSNSRSTRYRKRKSSSEGESGDEILVEEHSKLRDVQDKLCQKCLQTGQLRFCTTCSAGYHMECINVRSGSQHRPEEEWQCESCEVQSSDSDGDESEAVYDNKDERTAEICPRKRRGCATATRARIAAFTKRLRTSSWDDDGESSQQSNLTGTSDCEDLVRRSSRGSQVASDNLPLDNAVLQRLIAEMLNHEDAWPFRKPVRKSEAPEYHKVVKKPMDLGTVKYKLNTAEYCSNAEFVADILLVFKNCFMFNKYHTIEYNCALKMHKFFERRSKDLGLIWIN